MKFKCINLNYEKFIIININFPYFFFIFKAEVKLKAQTSEEKDLGCITLLKLAGEKSKNAGEMIKYEKLKNYKKVSKINIKLVIFQKRMFNQKLMSII